VACAEVRVPAPLSEERAGGEVYFHLITKITVF
jgi:hypothetical protein